MNHRLALALNTRVNGRVSAEAIYEDGKLRRRWQAGTSGKPFNKLPLDFSLDLSAGMNEKTALNETELSDYAGAWFDSAKSLRPDPGRGADGRDSRGSFRLRLNTIPIGTEFYFQGTSSYAGLKDQSQSGSMVRLDFPFGREGFRMLFRTEREYRRGLTRKDKSESGGFFEDGEIWAISLYDSLALMSSIPFYSFFDSRAGEHQFNDRFEYSFQGAMNYGLSSLFLPQRFSFRAARTPEYKLDTPRDAFSIGVRLGFSSVNLVEHRRIRIRTFP
jgi:hypothetical protein